MFLLWAALIKFLLLVLFFALPLAVVLTWMERRQSAYSQDRLGPQRAEIRLFGRSWRMLGLLHPIADGLKSLFKEPFSPKSADKLLFSIAPAIGFVASLVVLSLVPFGPDIATLDIPGIGWFLSPETLEALRQGRDAGAPSVVPLQVVRLDAGMLFVLAFGSLSVYGASLAGWASNNRFALLGGLRASSQVISYEIALGLAVVGVLLSFGTTELAGIVGICDPAQAGAAVGGVCGQARQVFAGLPAWGILLQPLAAVLFLTAGIAECKRGPFDLPEGESEIIGYFIEYSSMSFALFMLGEFIEIVVVASLFTTLFLGGWQLPWVFGATTWNLGVWSGTPDFFGLAPGFWNAIAGMAVFGLKVFFISALQLQIRWTLPRFRYDQLMRLGWKGLLPLGLANTFVTAALVYVDPSLNLLAGVGLALIILFVIVVVIGPQPVAAASEHAHDSAGDSHAKPLAVASSH